MLDSRIDEVTSVPAIQTRPPSPNVTGFAAASSPSGCTVPEREAALHREPGQRAVHRPGVEVAEAEPLGESPCDRALPCPCGAVNGDDHRLETELRRSKNPGKLIATASASPISTPSRETSPATAASTAMRWSPFERIRPPVGRVGTPLTSKPSSRARMRTPSVRRPFVTVSIRSDSFRRSSPAPVTRLSPCATAAASANSGSSSTRQRHLLRADVASRSARRSARRGRRSAPRRPCGG